MRITLLALGLFIGLRINAQINNPVCQTVICWECLWSGELKISTLPNVFTPNNDGRNDVWVPTFDAALCIETYHLEVFNRWGQKMYESFVYSEGWDGQVEGALQKPGTYYYILSYTNLITNKEVRLKGLLEMIY